MAAYAHFEKKKIVVINNKTKLMKGLCYSLSSLWNALIPTTTNNKNTTTKVKKNKLATMVIEKKPGLKKVYFEPRATGCCILKFIRDVLG